MILYSIKTHAGVRLEIEAETAAEAIEKSGLSPDEIRPWYPFPMREIKPPMPEEIKEKLRALTEERRSLRRSEKPRPVVEQTPAGPQYVAPGIASRTIPSQPLRARARQTEKPLALEMAEIEGRREGTE